MQPRVKKLLGVFLILPYLGAYVLAAIALADFVPRHWAAQLVYFAVAGIAWTFPLKRLLEWMGAPPKAQTAKAETLR